MPDRRDAKAPHVVVVGGGFGGIAAVRGLRRTSCRITLVDRRNHHVFQPLLYQVATAALSPADIALPIRSVLRDQRNVTVRLGEVVGVDRVAREVLSPAERIAFDYLILATGAQHSYFGKDEWAGAGVPGLAPAAKQQGRHAADVIRAAIKGHPSLRAFEYHHYGKLATIGRFAAVVEVRRLRLWGAPAWWLWGLAHVLLLTGGRNRAAIVLKWLWAYITYRRGTRLITGNTMDA
jgi:NADH dehydrogenase FAD-containing subunit